MEKWKSGVVTSLIWVGGMLLPPLFSNDKGGSFYFVSYFGMIYPVLMFILVSFPAYPQHPTLERDFCLSKRYYHYMFAFLLTFISSMVSVTLANPWFDHIEVKTAYGVIIANTIQVSLFGVLASKMWRSTRKE